LSYTLTPIIAHATLFVEFGFDFFFEAVLYSAELCILDAGAGFGVPALARPTVVPLGAPAIADAHVGLFTPVPVLTARARTILILFAETNRNNFP
jgi:hypothetical protein